MAQKIFPRSLRSQKLLSQDYSFYSEKLYAKLWAKGYELASHVHEFAQKNLSYKIQRKLGVSKTPRSAKNRKMPTFWE